jgi:hypothetical protein
MGWNVAMVPDLGKTAGRGKAGRSFNADSSVCPTGGKCSQERHFLHAIRGLKLELPLYFPQRNQGEGEMQEISLDI